MSIIKKKKKLVLILQNNPDYSNLDKKLLIETRDLISKTKEKVNKVYSTLDNIITSMEDSEKEVVIPNTPLTMNNIVNINDPYDIQKEYYNNILNTNKDLVKTSNDVPTPIECVELMINKIPIEVFKNPNLKWLDPCCGSGNFFIVIFNKLKEYHKTKHIMENMLYFNDTNLDRLEIVKSVFGHHQYKLNITNDNYLEYDESSKYDIIVANPPYAKILESGKRASKNHNLIGSFISKSFKILNSSGLLVYITPDNWMSYADRNILIKEITSKQILYLNIHLAKEYFKKIGSSFTWYIIENRDSYKDIEIEGIYKKNTYTDMVKSQIRNYIPLYYNRIIQSILSKTIDNTDLPKFHIETSSDLHKYTKKNCINDTYTEVFKYKLHHTPSQIVWSNRPHKYQEGYKVFIGTTSYYKLFIDDCGMTQSIAFIRCNSKEQAEVFMTILQHPLYLFINNICRWGNFNNIRILQSFPFCSDHDKVYSQFNITNEEIGFIEKNI